MQYIRHDVIDERLRQRLSAFIRTQIKHCKSFIYHASTSTFEIDGPEVNVNEVDDTCCWDGLELDEIQLYPSDTMAHIVAKCWISGRIGTYVGHIIGPITNWNLGPITSRAIKTRLNELGYDWC